MREDGDIAVLVCEIGQNHCGDRELARRLIREAKKNGGDLVKFQLYDHKMLYGDNPDIPNVELSFEQAKEYFEYGEEVGIEVFFSVFDVERVKWCEEIGVKRYKIAFSHRQNYEFMADIKSTGKPFIISTDIKMHAESFKTLYCVPKYPTNINDISFKEMDKFDGISDHSIGLDIAKIALARGTEIIEKHFAIDHKTGIDAPWSMTPSELRELKDWENTVKLCL